MQNLANSKALATFTTYASYPALDCLSQNFVQCDQAIRRRLNKYDNLATFDKWIKKV